MKAKIIRGDEAPVTKTDWGSLQWLLGGPGDARVGMTFGRVTIHPGQANPPHRHPNCDEILFVVAGEIDHALPEGGSARLRAGDCIVLPRGKTHQARNVGATDAVVIVAFNSAERETVGE